MVQLSFLSAKDQAQVDAKLAEIEESSQRAWACELTQQQQLTEHGYLLEVTVDGRFLQPIVLSSDRSAERICRELELLSRKLAC